MNFDHIQYLLPLMAAVLILLGARGIVTYLRANVWVRVPALLTSVSESYKDVWLSDVNKIKYYFPIVRYQYEFDGKRYSSNRVSLHIQDIWVPEVDNWGDKTKEEKKIWHQWHVGASIPVYIDPRRPHRSVIVREMPKKRRSHYLALITSGLLCLGIFAALKIWWEVQP